MTSTTVSVPVLPRHAPTSRDQSTSIDFLDYSVDELCRIAVETGEPAYRGAQLAHWLYKVGAVDLAQMTNLPGNFRHALAKTGRIGDSTVIDTIRTSNGDTEKALLRNADGATIETVLMRQPGTSGESRNTVCLSSQVGCAVGCPFCATGQAGWFRNLTAGEMVAQVLLWSRRLASSGEKIHNLVYMGMGEPLGNYDAVWKSITILNDRRAFGLGARHITLSTSGIAPRIERLAQEGIQINLAVSLHAPDDALRDDLVPLNRQYPIGRLLSACERYIEVTNRRVSFEYVLLSGVNDSPEQARDLANLVGRLLCHVNLIPLNPEPTSRFQAPSRTTVDAFADVLRSRCVPVTVRREHGQEIAAACGQLYRSSLERIRAR